MRADAKEELMLRVQSRKASLAEAVVSTAVGFCIAITFTFVLWHLYGVKGSVNATFQVTGWMTLISVIRGYTLRRLWNSEWWKKFRRKRVDVQPTTNWSHRKGVMVKVGHELIALNHEQVRELNPRVLEAMNKELQRVLLVNMHNSLR